MPRWPEGRERNYRLEANASRVRVIRNGQQRFVSPLWTTINMEADDGLPRTDDGTWSPSTLIGIAAGLKRIRRNLQRDEHRRRFSGIAGPSISADAPTPTGDEPPTALHGTDAPER